MAYQRQPYQRGERVRIHSYTSCLHGCTGVVLRESNSDEGIWVRVSVDDDQWPAADGWPFRPSDLQRLDASADS